MAPNQINLPALRINRAVRNSGRTISVPPVSDGVPEHTVAPDRSSEATSEHPAGARNAVSIALHVPDKQFVSFSKWVAGHIRVVAPEGVEVSVVVLPEVDGEVDFDQYRKPATLTIGKVVPK